MTLSSRLSLTNTETTGQWFSSQGEGKQWEFLQHQHWAGLLETTCSAQQFCFTMALLQEVKGHWPKTTRALIEAALFWCLCGLYPPHYWGELWKYGNLTSVQKTKTDKTQMKEFQVMERRVWFSATSSWLFSCNIRTSSHNIYPNSSFTNQILILWTMKLIGFASV